MPAQIEIGNLGDYHVKEQLYPQLQFIFQQMNGNWKVKVNGSANAMVWEVTVTSPQGKSHTKECFAEDDHCTTAYVLETVKKFAKRLD
jgi:hypothetical protein